ncbi:odorant receptor 23a-like isoform X2 [Nilaparvata lugens]|uniref:odorant receptor 23a-like isoform X2 n=1 Tax=Nilaparvata lugens TaxID=108931 RepID=UPI00193EBDE9|nr:odorant receptor 23a-like isoform X2 [Nilaparvata lugens]
MMDFIYTKLHGDKVDRNQYNSFLKIMKLLLIVSGLRKQSNIKELNLIVVIINVILLISGCITCLMSCLRFINDLNTFTEALMFFILFARVVGNYYSLGRNLRKINRFLWACETNFYDFEKKNLNEISNFKQMGDYSVLRFVVLMVSLFVSMFITYTSSFRFFPITSPWDNQINSSEFLSYVSLLYQIIVCFISSIVSLTDATLGLGSVKIICGETEILGRSLKSTDGNLQLKLSVKQHCFLISLMYNIQSIFSLNIFLIFISCEFMLCLCSFQIYQMHATMTIASLGKNICMLCALLFHEFVYFFYGQQLVNKTADIHHDVYFCKWYKKTAQFKSSTSIIQYRTKQPFIIMAGKIIPVTLASYVACLQAAFSYFNLLKALSHNQEG